MVYKREPVGRRHDDPDDVAYARADASEPSIPVVKIVLMVMAAVLSAVIGIGIEWGRGVNTHIEALQTFDTNSATDRQKLTDQYVNLQSEMVTANLRLNDITVQLQRLTIALATHDPRIAHQLAGHILYQPDDMPGTPMTATSGSLPSFKLRVQPFVPPSLPGPKRRRRPVTGP